jgi:hypothetical protein
MDAPTRRHRTSDKPIGKLRTIEPHGIDQRYLEVLKLLEPYHYFKFLTIPWLHYLTGIGVEYSVFRKYLGYLRQAPNHYLACPDQQNASPNVPYKALVFGLAERGLNELINRGIVPKRSSLSSDSKPTRSNRNHSFALHRSNSYLHEIIVDLGYYAPLYHLVHDDPALRLVDFATLIVHANVPVATRGANDPLLIQLKSGQLRFDGTPHLIIRRSDNGVQLPLGIPGIQVDRGTESFAQIETYLLHAIEFIEDHHHERHWGFENCFIPFLFTKEVRKNRAMQFVRDVRDSCPYLLFQTIPDLGLLHHFPKPEHYSRSYTYKDDEPRHPDNIHIFTNPWQRVGYPDFYLNTFDEKGDT